MILPPGHADALTALIEKWRKAARQIDDKRGHNQDRGAFALEACADDLADLAARMDTPGDQRCSHCGLEARAYYEAQLKRLVELEQREDIYEALRIAEKVQRQRAEDAEAKLLARMEPATFRLTASDRPYDPNYSQCPNCKGWFHHDAAHGPCVQDQFKGEAARMDKDEPTYCEDCQRWRQAVPCGEDYCPFGGKPTDSTPKVEGEAALVPDLRAWAQHDVDCGIYDNHTSFSSTEQVVERGCTCGLQAVLDAQIPTRGAAQ